MPDSQNRPLRVFLCHSSGDKPTVRELYRQLSAEGWMDVWLDEEKLYPGQDWNLEIEKAVEAADAILVCLSNNSITKEGYVQRELRIVLDYADYKPEGTLYLIPVRLEPCEPPRRLRPWQYADYFPKDERDRAYQRLLVSLRMRADSLGISTEKPQVKPAPSVSRTGSPARTKPVPETPKVEPKRVSLTPAVTKTKAPAKTTPGGHTIYTFGEIEFVKVPAGRFLMGSDKNDKGAYGDEMPQHVVDIPRDYYIGRFPITNEQFAAYVKAKGIKHPVSGSAKKRDHPVVNVSWEDAMTYCKWLNDFLKGRLPSGLVLRLPTEAEWEKAARWQASPGGRGQGEGKSLIYPWGDTFDKNKCNTYEGGRGDTTPVGAYSPRGDSPYGCADMSGNVWEWTHSLFKPYPYNVSDGREDERADGNRGLRGGSFNDDVRYARCAARDADQIDILSYGGGFRVAASPDLS